MKEWRGKARESTRKKYSCRCSVCVCVCKQNTTSNFFFLFFQFLSLSHSLIQLLIHSLTHSSALFLPNSLSLSLFLSSFPVRFVNRPRQCNMFVHLCACNI